MKRSKISEKTFRVILVGLVAAYLVSSVIVILAAMEKLLQNC